MKIIERYVFVLFMSICTSNLIYIYKDDMMHYCTHTVLTLHWAVMQLIVEIIICILPEVLRSRGQIPKSEEYSSMQEKLPWLGNLNYIVLYNNSMCCNFASQKLIYFALIPKQTLNKRLKRKLCNTLISLLRFFLQ